jgi:hypothetical protein
MAESDIYETKEGRYGGTWVCKELAVKLAAWISPAFEVQVMRWAYSIITDDMANVIPDVVAAHDAINNTTSIVEVKSVDNTIISKKRKLEEIELDEQIAKHQQNIVVQQLGFKQVLQDLGSWDERDDLRLGGQLKCILGLQNPEILVEPEDIDISTIAKDMGYPQPKQGQLTSIGKKLKALYMTKHDGAVPPQHKRYNDGAVRLVNVYTTDDQAIMEQVIEIVLSKK